MKSLKSLLIAGAIPLLTSCGGTEDVSGLYQFTREFAFAETIYEGLLTNEDLANFRIPIFATEEVTKSEPGLLSVLNEEEGKITVSNPRTHTYELNGETFCDQWTEERGLRNNDYILCGTIGNDSITMEVFERIQDFFFFEDLYLVHAYTGRKVIGFK